MPPKEHAKFHSIVLLTYCLNKLYGLSPFSYNFTTRTCTASSVAVAYCIVNILFLLFFYPTFCIPLYYAMVNANFEGNLESTVGTAQGTIEFIAVILTQCVYLYYRKEIIVYFNRKIAYEKKIVQYSQTLYGGMHFVIRLIVLIAIFLLKLCANHMTMYIIPSITLPIFIILTINLVPNAVMTLAGCNFTMEVITLRYFAAQINFMLCKIGQLTNLPQATSTAKKTVIYCKASEAIDELLILHSELNEILVMFNKVQSFVLLLFFMNKFAELIIPIFFVYLAAIGLSIADIETNVYISIILTNIFSFLELKMATMFSDQLINEIATTGKILHEFPIQNADDRLKESINRFSIQILQEKRPIIVCGMYRVDNSLLYIMASSMTSYLILLIQFQIEARKSGI
uniref:Gustatory receptor n=1 Tax=Phlebotomus papatasi TaxID=29031 RepID=A0A240SYU0_PHLPP